MTTEYWLQKKTIGGWSLITWYDNEEQARTNYNECCKAKGYAYRLVKVETLELQPLEDMVEIVSNPGHQPTVEKPVEPRPLIKTVDPWSIASKPENVTVINPIWNAAPSWGDPTPPKSEHGLSGSVWIVHHGLKQKSRVPANELASYLEKGYERGGPRTEFK